MIIEMIKMGSKFGGIGDGKKTMLDFWNKTLVFV